MSCHSVYLEVAADGLTMVHVPDLPGCFTRADSREEALARVPTAVREYHSWLRQHGEPAPVEEDSIEVTVAGESSGFGPFVSGDAAALFSPDTAPLAPEAMARYCHLLAYSRADLLALAGNLPDDLLDWQPSPESHSIRRVLRHVGNAEEWYVSRLVAPETLPPEWEHDEDMPLDEFLEMERRTALTRLEQLTADERSATFHPTCWTDHPEEPWTASKALRRFLEHEREHTGQMCQILAARRQHLLAHLAAARGELLEPLTGLDERDLAQTLVNEGWTAKDTLAHIAAWERWVRREIGRLVAGEKPDTAAVRDINAYNSRNVAAWKGRPLDDVVAELRAARTAWVQWMKDLPEEEFFHRRPWGRGDWWLPTWVEVFREHDHDEHAAKLGQWRTTRQEIQGGPKAVLEAALEARREELLAAAALVPPAERATRAVCGTWTLKDALGHVADWEAWILPGLRDMAAARPPAVAQVDAEDEWNRSHAAARREQPWEKVWADFRDTREELEQLLAAMSQDDLERPFPGVWDEQTTPYAWFLVCLAHDREHARGVRAAMSALAGPAEGAPQKAYRSRGRK